jgi:hypothetical protein
MLLDKNGNPIASSKQKWINRLSKYKDTLKNRMTWIITSLGTLAIILANLTNILNFYEHVTDGPVFMIPIEIHNNNNKDSVKISKLLDLYITATQFYSGRLMSGEQPTSRVYLKPDNNSSSYEIQPNSTNKYQIIIKQRPYRTSLSNGGDTIVFVLRREDDTYTYYIEQPFHPDILNSMYLSYTIN